MAIGVALFILAGAVFIGYPLSKGKSKKRTLITWGIVIMIGIAPFFSWLAGISYGVYAGSGFAGGAIMVLLFGILFLIGPIILLAGIFKKSAPSN